jgi:hypothetical protein
MTQENNKLSERDRKEIERIARKHGPELVTAIAFNAPKPRKRGGPNFWSTPDVKSLISIAEAVAENPELAKGRDRTDVLLAIAKTVRNAEPGLPALYAAKEPAAVNAGKIIGAQNKTSVERQIRRIKKNTRR